MHARCSSSRPQNGANQLHTGLTRPLHTAYAATHITHTTIGCSTSARRARATTPGDRRKSGWPVPNFTCSKTKQTEPYITCNRRRTTHHRHLPPSNLMRGKRQAGKGLNSSGRHGTATWNSCPLLDTITQRKQLDHRYKYCASRVASDSYANFSPSPITYTVPIHCRRRGWKIAAPGTIR